jgi:hypothetical protein
MNTPDIDVRMDFLEKWRAKLLKSLARPLAELRRISGALRARQR